MSSNTCDYTAYKEKPETWQRRDSSEFFLDRDPMEGGLGISEWRCPHSPLGEEDGDEENCIFHTETEVSADHQQEELLKALDEAGDGPWEDRPEHRGQFVGATFSTVDLSEEVIAATENYDIRFDHAQFNAKDSSLSFEDIRFVTRGQFPISFYGASLTTEGSGDILFKKAKFITQGDGAVWFEETAFTTQGDGSVRFEEAMFATKNYGDVEFEGAEFASDGGDVQFDEAMFTTEGKGDVEFWGATFTSDSGNIQFNKAIFVTQGEGNVEFGFTRFITQDDGTVWFRGAKFINDGDGLVWFEKARFIAQGDGHIRFEKAQFIIQDNGESGVRFREARFIIQGNGNGSVRFYGAKFITQGGGDVQFEKARFITQGDGHVQFGSARFRTRSDKNVEFGQARFIAQGDGHIRFQKAQFIIRGDGSVRFREARFITQSNGHVQFGSARFIIQGDGKGDVEFGLVDFTTQGDVEFEKAKFLTEGDGNVWFVGATFTAKDNGDVQFEETTFATQNRGHVKFEKGRFITEGDGNVQFSETTFTATNKGDVQFESARFITQGGGDVQFEKARFITQGDGEVGFPKAIFTTDGEVNFANTIFRGDISFMEAEYNGVTSFVDSWIQSSAALSFSKADFFEPCLFGVSDGVRYFCGTLDFSDVTFHSLPNFFGNRTSIESQIESGELATNGRGQTKHSSISAEFRMFDLVFADHITFAGATFPDGVDFSKTRFPEENTSFAQAKLSGVNFVKADLSGVSLERAQLNRAELLGTRLVGAKLYGALLGDARINRETTFWPEVDISFQNVVDLGDSPVHNGALLRGKTRLRGGAFPYCCYDPRYAKLTQDIPIRGTTAHVDLDKAVEVYGTLETVARNNSLLELSSECFLGRKDAHIRQYWEHDDNYGRQWWMTGRSFVPNLVARYGESPWRVLGTGTFTILVCGLVYWAFDLVARTNSQDETATFLESIYFSALTFTTLSYGDFRPTSIAGQFLAVAETSMGVVLLAILVFVFGRRATR